MAAESYENPIAERVNGTLKDELLPTYPNTELARADIQKAILIYNEKRPHRSLNRMMPIAGRFKVPEVSVKSDEVT